MVVKALHCTQHRIHSLGGLLLNSECYKVFFALHSQTTPIFGTQTILEQKSMMVFCAVMLREAKCQMTSSHYQLHTRRNKSVWKSEPNIDFAERDTFTMRQHF